MTTIITCVAIGLTIGNFVYQALGAQDYTLAVERTFFQAVALFIAWFLLLWRQAIS